MPHVPLRRCTTTFSNWKAWRRGFSFFYVCVVKCWKGCDVFVAFQFSYSSVRRKGYAQHRCKHKVVCKTVLLWNDCKHLYSFGTWDSFVFEGIQSHLSLLKSMIQCSMPSQVYFMSSAWIKLMMVSFTTKWRNHQHHLWTLLAPEYHILPSEEHLRIVFANFFALVVFRKFNFAKTVTLLCNCRPI